VNCRNNSGNTPLHWAALNAHLECVKALVEAGADLDVKNDAGHDAVFLAERTAWAAVGEDEGNEGEGDDAQTQEIEMTIGGDEGEEKSAQDAGEMSAGRQVVEWLLNSDVAASLEKGATEGESGSA
jgi:ankyrin repeat protein